MEKPTEYDPVNHAVTSGFLLDNRSEITINSVDITPSLLSARAVLSIAPRFGYQTESTYRKIYMVAGSGKFDSIADLERYLKTNDLWRNR